MGVFEGYNYLVIDKYDNTLDKYDLNLDLIKFFKDSIEIIKHIHVKGLVHRDIKPENLMLDSNKKLFLLILEFQNYF